MTRTPGTICGDWVAEAQERVDDALAVLTRQCIDAPVEEIAAARLEFDAAQAALRDVRAKWCRRV